MTIPGNDVEMSLFVGTGTPECRGSVAEAARAAWRKGAPMRDRIVTSVLIFIVAGAAAARADEKPTEFSLGLSYLATSGNTDSKTGGLDVSYKRSFDPWGLEATASYLRAESNGTETANHAAVAVRGTRTISERWSGFVGASWLRDTYAGLDSRYVLSAGVTFKAMKTEFQALSFDLGAAWNADNLVVGGSDHYASGLAGMAYTWTISPTSKFTENLLFVPSFKDSQDWRVASDTGLEAAISAKLALKLSYEYLYDNVPVPGFRKTDTKTAVSLVVKL